MQDKVNDITSCFSFPLFFICLFRIPTPFLADNGGKPIIISRKMKLKVTLYSYNNVGTCVSTKIRTCPYDPKRKNFMDNMMKPCSPLHAQTQDPWLTTSSYYDSEKHPPKKKIGKPTTIKLHVIKDWHLYMIFTLETIILK